MCQHMDFRVVYYEAGILIRKCNDCNQLEVRLDWDWIDLELLKETLRTFSD